MSAVTLSNSAPTENHNVDSVARMVYRTFFALLALSLIFMLGAFMTGHAATPSLSLTSIQKASSIQSAPLTYTNESAGGILG